MMVVHLECKEPTSEDMEPEMGHQEKVDAWIVDMKDGQKEKMQANLVNTEPACKNGIRDRSLRKQAHKEPRRQTAAISEEGEDNNEQHRRVELRTVNTSGKWRNAQEGPI
jgi:hypothetical protein